MAGGPGMIDGPSGWVVPADGGGGRGRAAIFAEVASAPAALVTQVGILVFVFQTKPVRPYAGGEWALGDLVMLVALGVLAGFVGRGLPGLAGVVLGMTGAVALQLFVLTGQASWTPTVATTLQRSSWLPTVGASLGLGLAAIVGGYALTRVAWHVLEPGPRDQESPSERSPWRAAAPIIVAVVAVLVTGLLLLDASASAYVPQFGPHRARGDAGQAQMIGGLLAAVVAGWAAAGTVIAAKTARWLGCALLVGFATALVLGSLAALAIDVTHNPF
ncbi:MAG: hypothetical protein WCH74_03680 [Chloroflexota bacterium]